ncbi:MAG: deoxyribose-phosphate aldolase [Acidimicrobiales bacterium]|nr:deoxyribose-phosphate aldolase [Acidimicrobiales bacterium]
MVSAMAGVRPRVILAADHRARGVFTVERYADLVGALRAALPHADGLLATVQPLADLVGDGSLAGKDTYLSINRTGLAGTPFELDDRLVASVGRAAADGCTGIKHMTRIDRSDPVTADALELLGRVLEEARSLGLDALIEPLGWVAGAIDRTTGGIVEAAVIAHDMGAPLLKVPVPADVVPGPARVDAVHRIVESVGAPVLFLGGPRRAGDRAALLGEVADAMAGGAAGLAIGRAIYQDPDPAAMCALAADLVHGRRPADEVLAATRE